MTAPRHPRSSWGGAYPRAPLHDRAKLDGASHPHGRNACGELEHGVVVIALEHVEGAQGSFTRVEKRPRNLHDLVFLDTDRRRLFRSAESVVTAYAGEPGQSVVLGMERMPLLCGYAMPGAWRVIDEEGVPHV